MMAWSGLGSEISQAVEEQNRRLLETYRADPKRLEEDANTERSIHEGAYADRQLYELLQNAADAMRAGGGRCEVLLTDHTLYVANSGEPLSVHGVETLMAAHLSAKRDEQIGRFGLGFKSVLAVTDSPKIFSRSGSLGFDRDRSRRTLSREIPGQPHYPVARLADTLDPSDARHADPVLDGLMKWATTVVVLPRLLRHDVLKKAVNDFPPEFLLFSQQVAQLDLEDRSGDTARRITLARDDKGLLRLDNAGRKSTWIVTSRTHTPSATALKDGGYQAARESVELTWAAPVEGATQRVGSCWAYFPTGELTTLSGIINAPWKLADDRARLLTGAFNDELLTRVLPGVVSNTLPRLAEAGRPTAAIDVLPARGKEIRGWADGVLGQPVIDAVGSGPCIPTMTGRLSHPTRVNLHPKAATAEELEIWASACTDPERWVHHDIQSDERRSKVLRLMSLHRRGETDVKAWVEHIAKNGSVEGSAAAVRIYASMVRRDPSLREALKKARVLLLEDGSVAAPRRGQVFLPGGPAPEGRLIIDGVLAADPQVEKALKSLGIEIFDDAGNLRSELAKEPIGWEQAWSAARRLARPEAGSIFRETFGKDLVTQLRVRTYSGRWKRAGEVFLPGPIIPGDGSRDGDYVVDHRFHQRDIDLLSDLGLVDRPHRSATAPMEQWRLNSIQDMRNRFRNVTQQPRIPDESITVDDGHVLWPLQFLPQLSVQGRAAVTHCVLTAMTGEERWTARRVGGGRAFQLVDPTWAWVAEHGVLETEVGPEPIRSCLADAPDDLDECDRICLPYVTDIVSAQQEQALHLKAGPEKLADETWMALFHEASRWESLRRFQLYAWAATLRKPAPTRIKVDRGPGFVEVSPDSAAVTADTEVHRTLVNADIPTVRVNSQDDAEALVDEWGLAVGEDMLVQSVSTDVSGEKFAAIDRFPPLAHEFDREWQNLEIQPCSRIELLTRTPKGEQSTQLASRLDGRVLFTTAVHDRDLLSIIAGETGSSFQPHVILQRMEKQRQNQLLAAIRATDDVIDKLVLAVGADELRSSIPFAALTATKQSLGREPAGHEIARLALAVDGYSILKEHSHVLKEKGLEPPSQWAGRGAARTFVRRLGFPSEFAGFRGSERAGEIEVAGPPTLGELHDYQMKIAERIKRLFTASARTNRGLVSLPTGAGKTRVAVQAIVEHMAQVDDALRVVWIAETEELCEQAVQSWEEIWRAYGRPGTPMSLNRLWRSNEVSERDGLQVVVASVDKLASIVSRDKWTDSYGWLQKPSIVVVDEAHRSIVKQYNKVLTALADARRVVDMEIPLLGLTATPFRGFNKEETERLIRRYDTRLDEGVFGDDDVYPHLQQMGVLARVRQAELTGADITLTEEEKDQASSLNQLSDRVTKELSQNETRNNTIVDSILGLPEMSRILLFATSIENARVLAALLSYRGVDARAVSGETSAAARRQYVEDFKAGRVRVLTNYNVFTEGFDVPAVDAVYITRPTFSPNVYQQMIGRGLRGPMNGGSKEVLIVNVADNLTNFGMKFAFHHFDHLWKEQA